MKSTLAYGIIASFLIALMAIGLAVLQYERTMGYTMLLVFLLIFGIYLFVVFRGYVMRKLREADYQLASIPDAQIYKHRFDYVCPACLYQTNDYKGMCPRCGRRRLVETYKQPMGNGEDQV